jgi:hypothetical protein
MIEIDHMKMIKKQKRNLLETIKNNLMKLKNLMTSIKIYLIKKK